MHLVTAAIVVRDGKFLLTRRCPEDAAGGLWEFPGGSVEPDETPDQGIVREMMEETALTVRPVSLYACIATDWGGVLLFYLCSARGEGRAIECEQLSWVPPEELTRYDTHKEDRALMARVADEAKGIFDRLARWEEAHPWQE